MKKKARKSNLGSMFISGGNHKKTTKIDAALVKKSQTDLLDKLNKFNSRLSKKYKRKRVAGIKGCQSISEASKGLLGAGGRRGKAGGPRLKVKRSLKEQVGVGNESETMDEQGGDEVDFNSEFKGLLGYKQYKQSKNIFLKAGKDNDFVYNKLKYFGSSGKNSINRRPKLIKDVQDKMRHFSDPRKQEFFNFSSKFDPRKMRSKNRQKSQQSAPRSSKTPTTTKKTQRNKSAAIKIFSMSFLKNRFFKTSEGADDCSEQPEDPSTQRGTQKLVTRPQSRSLLQEDHTAKNYGKLAFSDSKGLTSLTNQSKRINRLNFRSEKKARRAEGPKICSKDFEESLATRRDGEGLANPVMKTEAVKIKPSTKFPCGYRYQSQKKLDVFGGMKMRHVSSFSDFIQKRRVKKDVCPPELPSGVVYDRDAVGRSSVQLRGSLQLKRPGTRSFKNIMFGGLLGD